MNRPLDAILYVSSVCIRVGDEKVNEKLRWRDAAIFLLTQQMSTMQQKIENLESENAELIRQHFLASFKKEGTS